MVGAIRIVCVVICWLSVTEGFNHDDNYHGYTGYCPEGWNEIDQLCYKTKHDDKDFRDALEECTSHRDNYHIYWEQGSRFVGPRYNLMPVAMLHSLMEHGQNARARLGKGPYRVNAIKTSHDHKWREYDGGSTNIDVYSWKGGREINFEMFPNFNTEWGRPGDTLVWYPRTNKLYSRPHYHQYQPLCYRKKKDAERCPGIPECNYNGDCYNGKCYCYTGYVGDDCCCKPKILIAGGSGDDVTFEPGHYHELFDFETMTSCLHSETTYDFTDGEMEMVGGEVYYCGGVDASNETECLTWSRKDQLWVDFGTTVWPRAEFDSVIVPKVGWWLYSGIVGTPFLNKRNDVLLLKDRSEIVDSDHLAIEWNQGFCIVQISDYRTAVIGGGGEGDDSGSINDINIYDWGQESWLTSSITIPGSYGFEDHECETVMDPKCGHPIVVIVGGTGVNKVVHWDTFTDEFKEVEDLPYTTITDHEMVKIDDETVVIIGGTDGTDEQTGIYTYKINEGFQKIGDMIEARVDLAATVVWGEDFVCTETIVPSPGS